MAGGFFTTEPSGKIFKFFKKKKKHTFIPLFLFIWLCWVLIVACGIFGCYMWDLGPWPGMELRPPAFSTQSLSHQATREVPEL